MWQQNLNWLPNLTANWLGFTAIFFGTLIPLSVLAYYVVRKIERRFLSSGRWPKRFSFVSKFFLSAEFFFLSLALLFVPTLVEMPPQALHFVRALGRVGLIVSATVIILKIADVFCSSYLRNLALQKADNLRERKIATKLRYLQKIFEILICLIALALILLGFEQFRKIGSSLLASAGLASLVLGLAAQRSLGTWIAGLQVAFTQPIRIGDAVLVENEWGEIEEINLTYVVIRIWDLRRLVVPITYFLEKPFQNWTRHSADLVGSVLMPLDYCVPVNALREELSRVLKASSLWDGKINELQVVDANQNSLTIRALVSARNSGATWHLRCEVREKLLAFVQTHHPEALPKTRFSAQGETALSAPPV